MNDLLHGVDSPLGRSNTEAGHALTVAVWTAIVAALGIVNSYTHTASNHEMSMIVAFFAVVSAYQARTANNAATRLSLAISDADYDARHTEAGK